MATEEDKVNTGVLLTIGAVLALATLGVALAVTALVRREASDLGAEKGATANLRPVQELRQQHTQSLEAAPTWFDQAAKQVSIPIERAKQLVIEDVKKDPNKATAPTPPPPDAGKTSEDAGAAATDAGLEGGAPAAAGDGGAAPSKPDGGAAAAEPGKPKAPKAPAPPEPPTPPAEPEQEP